MRNVKMIIAAVILLSSTQFAQYKKGQWELGFTGSVGSTTQSSKSSGTSGSYDNSIDTDFFDISLLPGYYLLDGFSIEPEFGFFAIKDEKPSYNLIANLSYTFMFPYSSNAFFIKAGYGLGNAYALPMADEFLVRVSNKFDVTILNLGTGVKFFVGEKVYIRCEANYRIQSWQREYSYSYPPYYYSNDKSEYSWKTLRLKVGLGILI
ncbi:MAG: outer membrane beta-barrel protein [Ignavibacteria bacterium]|nr:outer membrane beta-barrel protein [Ignavibacteria bacterium]